MTPSRKLALVPPYLFAALDQKIAEARAAGRDVINLGIGDPDLPTPKAVVDAMHDAINDPATHNYPPYRGTGDFRKAAAAWMQNRFGVSVNAETETISLLGSKEGIAHLIAAYVDPGDVVLAPSPGYPVYRTYTLLCGGEPYTMPLLPENGFLPDYTKIPADILKRAKIMFLNYPNNPTGAVASEDFIKKSVAFCREHGILLCHDNAYSEMTFDGYRAPSFLSVPGAKDVCLEMFSLSKMYNMTGWRVGFAVGNKSAIDALAVVKNNCDSGVFKAIQQAAIAALSQSDALLKDLNAIYARRRDIMVAGLRDMGWPLPDNVATFYLWVPAPAGYSDADFAALMLEKCDIVITPGSGYGETGKGYFRIALTQSDARIEEAVRRMKAQGLRFAAAPSAQRA